MSRRKSLPVGNPSDVVVTLYCTKRGDHDRENLTTVHLRSNPSDGQWMLAARADGKHDHLKKAPDGRARIDEQCPRCPRHLQLTASRMVMLAAGIAADPQAFAPYLEGDGKYGLDVSRTAMLG